MLLPARMAVLNYLSTVKNADINEIMEAMKPQYGHEKQFTKDMYLDHTMSLEANGMCTLVSHELDVTEIFLSGLPLQTTAAQPWKNTFLLNTAADRKGETAYEILW